MLRPMSYASTRGSRMSYASQGMGGGDPRMSMGGDRRMSSYGDRRMSSFGGNDPRMTGHQRASSHGGSGGDRRTSRHAPSPQSTYRQSILRNSVVADEQGRQLMADAQGRQRGSILMNRDDVEMARDGSGVRPVDEPFVPNPYSRHSYGHARGESYGPTNREAFVHLDETNLLRPSA